MTLKIPTEWCSRFAVLLARVVGADSPPKFQPIVSLLTIRKLLSYTFVQMLPLLTFFSLQTGFVPGAQAAEGVFVIKRVAELSREWGKELCLVQLDLCKAFDRVKHSAAILALKLQSASLQCIAVFCAMMLCSSMAFTLGGITTQQIKLDRGLPQGAPESPGVIRLDHRFNV